MNKLIKELFYIGCFVLLAFIITFIIFVTSFYIHEMGHASFATFTAMSLHYPTENLTLNYQTYFGFLKLPQQTEVILPISTLFSILYGISGVLLTSIFYILFFLILAGYNNKIRENVNLQKYLIISVIILIIKDVFENWLCGTDGLKLSCSNLTLGIGSLLFWMIFMFFLSLFLLGYYFKKKRLRSYKLILTKRK